MCVDNGPTEAYDVVSAGVDWLTCTAKNSDSSIRLERLADEELHRQRATGEEVRQAFRLGFVGWKGAHMFFGRREHDVMLQLSGPACENLTVPALALCSNVSRIDFQVTVFSGGEQLELARDTWRHLKSAGAHVGRPRSFNIIVNHPAGSTLMVNSRAGDNHGRIYDKGVESKLGPAGMLWRYEIELKRQVAQRASKGIVPETQLSAYAIALVHRWMAQRDCRPPWDTTGYDVSADGRLQAPSQDLMSWFRSSVSKSVARGVKQYGLNAVLDGLGLLAHVTPKEKTTNGNL